MRYFIRTTHNFNNTTREWEFRENLRNIEVKTMGLGVHALHSHYWMTLKDIEYEHKQYCKSYYDAYMPSTTELEDDLLKLEMADMIKSKEV